MQHTQTYPFPTNPVMLPSSAFDHGTFTATSKTIDNMNMLSIVLKQLGFDVELLSKHLEDISSSHAQQRLKKIHDAAALLHMQWERACQSRDIEMGFAAARLFNGLTSVARVFQKKYALVDISHITRLKKVLHNTIKKRGIVHIEKIISAVGDAAKERPHEVAWLWVVLPTFFGQHYGRILLGKVDTGDSWYPAFIMQPTFKKGYAPQLHTHGQNWAIATPLGDLKKQNNIHVNTLWQMHCRDSAFPLRQLPNGKAMYGTQQVVVIPPRMIHSISKLRFKQEYVPSLLELAYDKSKLQSTIDTYRFGELSCLHVYFPDPILAKNLTRAPFIQKNPAFFMENDMIVFDNFTNPPCIWAGSGGVWVKRMVRFGTAGEHCGICFQENDYRRHNLDPKVVYDWLVKQSSISGLQVYNKKNYTFANA